MPSISRMVSESSPCQYEMPVHRVGAWRKQALLSINLAIQQGIPMLRNYRESRLSLKAVRFIFFDCFCHINISQNSNKHEHISIRNVFLITFHRIIHLSSYQQPRPQHKPYIIQYLQRHQPPSKRPTEPNKIKIVPNTVVYHVMENVIDAIFHSSKRDITIWEIYESTGNQLITVTTALELRHRHSLGHHRWLSARQKGENIERCEVNQDYEVDVVARSSVPASSSICVESPVVRIDGFLLFLHKCCS